jgi:hypothetical protein
MRAARLALLAAAAARGVAAFPCDIYAKTPGAPCVAAFSLVRALYSDYAGVLYTVRRASDNTTAPVGVLSPGGYANSSAQDAFCAGTSCQIFHIIDQSAYGNNMAPAPPGGTGRHLDSGVNASALPVRLPSGQRAYGALFLSGLNQGYRLDLTNSVAVGNEAETIYMVSSGLPQYVDNHCCFECVRAGARARARALGAAHASLSDPPPPQHTRAQCSFGNAESNNLDTGEGSMEAVYIGTYNASGKGWCGGEGAGPWVMADLESGIWACADRPGTNPKALPQTSTFVTGMVKGYGDVAPYGRWVIKAGDAAQGPLATTFDGPRPAQAPKRAPYYPMRLTGSIILGIGGACAGAPGPPRARAQATHARPFSRSSPPPPPLLARARQATTLTGPRASSWRA